MKEQIEEMVDDLMACHVEFGEDDDIRTDYDATATMLYRDKGYRKQSEGEWIVDGDDKYRRAECSNCGHEYAVQKGMLQLHRFPYCPNCGAKMKGGAE